MLVAVGMLVGVGGMGVLVAVGELVGVGGMGVLVGVGGIRVLVAVAAGVDGVSTGPSVGAWVGTSVGSSVGESVGTGVVCCVGASVGAKDGVMDGPACETIGRNRALPTLSPAEPTAPLRTSDTLKTKTNAKAIHHREIMVLYSLSSASCAVL